MESLRWTALLWAVGDQPYGDLPDFAAAMLVDGSDSPSLRELAGASADDFWEVKTLFERTLDEFGVPILDEQAALWAIARRVAQEIVDGDRPSGDGAIWIWRHVSNRIEQEGDLRVFLGLGSEFEDHPDDATIGTAVVEAAAELLSRSEPRRWLRVQARSRTSPVVDSGTRAAVNVQDLPVTDETARAVDQWAERYDALFDPGNTDTGFADEHEARTFVEQGRQLVARLQGELGDSWHVEYMPEATKPPGLKLRTPPN